MIPLKSIFATLLFTFLIHVSVDAAIQNGDQREDGKTAEVVPTTNAKSIILFGGVASLLITAALVLRRAGHKNSDRKID